MSLTHMKVTVQCNGFHRTHPESFWKAHFHGSHADLGESVPDFPRFWTLCDSTLVYVMFMFLILLNIPVNAKF